VPHVALKKIIPHQNFELSSVITQSSGVFFTPIGAAVYSTIQHLLAVLFQFIRLNRSDHIRSTIPKSVLSFSGKDLISILYHGRIILFFRNSVSFSQSQAVTVVMESAIAGDYRHEIGKIALRIEVIVESQKGVVLLKRIGRFILGETLAEHLSADTKCDFRTKRKSTQPKGEKVHLLWRRLLHKIGT